MLGLGRHIRLRYINIEFVIEEMSKELNINL